MEMITSTLGAVGIQHEHLRPLFHGTDPLYVFDVRGEAAADAWQRLHNAASETGWSPLILGDARQLVDVEDRLSDHDVPPTKAIQQAGSVDVARWFAIRRGSEEAYVSDQDWPAGVDTNNDLLTVRDLRSRRYLDRVGMTMIPTRASWEALAYVRFGGWNDCPATENHVAIWHRWHDQYGADVAVANHDVIEARVKRPPTTRAAALTLAEEQVFYCVEKFGSSFEELAASLMESRVWYFWWD